MNGPKVRQILKSSSVSQKSAQEMISRFLNREGNEEIVLHENLTRLLAVCQSMTNQGHSKKSAIDEGVSTASHDEKSSSEEQRLESKAKKKRKKISTVSSEKKSLKRKRGKDITLDSNSKKGD